TLSHTTSLLDPAPLRELLAEAIDLERVRASPLRLVVVTTDLARREARLFDNQTITHDALLATVAVPGLFPPVEVDGAPLVDGGLVARAPILEALATGVPVQRAIVTLSYAPADRPRPSRRLREVFEDAFETLMVHQIRRDAELGRLRHRIDVQVIEPSAPLLLRPLDFESGDLSEALACGLGGWLLVRHLVAHDAALAGDLARLLLTRSLPASLFVPAAVADPALYARTMNDIAAADDVVRVVLYDAQARVLWSDDTALIGRRFAHDNELRGALGGEIEAKIIRPGKEEHEGLRSFTRIEEIYLPVRYARDGP